MKKQLFLLSAACLCLPVMAQTLRVEGTCTGDEFKNMKFYAKPMEKVGQEDLLKLTESASGFTGDVPSASDGFYYLFGASDTKQVMMPLYLPNAQKKYELNLQWTGNCAQVDLDADNRALSAFNSVIYTKGKDFWMNGAKLKPEQILPYLKEYNEKSDSIIALYQCSAPVKAYLKLWTYLTVYACYESTPRIVKMEKSALPFQVSDLLAEPSEVLDTPMTTYFQAGPATISGFIPKGGLEERLTFLHKRYSCKPILKLTESSLVNEYIRRFDFEKNYEAGVAELTALTEKFGLDGKYLTDFKMRKASVQGTPFPKNIKLTDAEGNTVDFSSFKGSYIYVDLWASWCGPCCREVPALQKLEKEMEGTNVKFVSISIDTSESAWKAKMKALNMGGNQLLNKDNKLAEALNVKGIPFFLIYDKEGKLYVYNAPRPSSGEALKKIFDNIPKE